MAITQSIFLKFFSCSRFSEIDSKMFLWFYVFLFLVKEARVRAHDSQLKSQPAARSDSPGCCCFSQHDMVSFGV